MRQRTNRRDSKRRDTERRGCRANEFACERLEDRVLLSGSIDFIQGGDQFDGLFNDVEVVDVDQDGDLDLVGFVLGAFNSAEPDSIRVLLNEGQGVFSDPIDSSLNTRESFWKIAFAQDLNADGTPDLVVQSGTLVYHLAGQGDGRFDAPVLLTNQPSQPFFPVDSLDANDDGLPDLLVPLPAGTSRIWLNTGGAFVQGDLVVPPINMRILGVARLNNDGIEDLYAYSAGTSSFVPMFGQSDGSYAVGPVSLIQTAPTMHDLNGDGLDDIITSLGFRMGVILNTGNGIFDDFLGTEIIAGSPGVQAIADFNGDGIPDLLGDVGNLLNQSALVLGTGDGHFGPIVSEERLAGPGFIGLFDSLAFKPFDVNEDGFLDVLVTKVNVDRDAQLGTVPNIAVLSPGAERLDFDTTTAVPGRVFTGQVSGADSLTPNLPVDRVVVFFDMNHNGGFDSADQLLTEATRSSSDTTTWEFTGVWPDHLDVGFIQPMAVSIDTLGTQSQAVSVDQVDRIVAQQRVFFSEGFRNDRRVTERLILRGGDHATRFWVIAHYGNGLEQSQFIMTDIIGVNARRKIVLSKRGRPGAAKVDPNTPYSIEVVSNWEIGASIRRVDNFGSAPADRVAVGASLTDYSTTTFGFADLDTGSFDFLGFFNPFDRDVSLTTIFYHDGQEVAAVPQFLKGLRRGGMSLRGLVGKGILDADTTYSAVVSADHDVLASVSSFEPGGGDGTLAPGSVSRGESLARVRFGPDETTALVLFNPTDAPVQVDLATTYDGVQFAGTDSMVTLMPFEQRSIDPALGAPAGARAGSVRINSSTPVYASARTSSPVRLDSIDAGDASLAASSWIFADSIFRPGSSIDSLVIRNPAMQTTEITLTIKHRGRETVRQFFIAASSTVTLDLTLEPGLRWSDQAGSFFVGIEADNPILGMLDHWEPTTHVAWSALGTPLGPIVNLADL